MRLLNLPQAKLASLAKGIANHVKGAPDEGDVYRLILESFWRGEIKALNSTREQLRDRGSCRLSSLKNLPEITSSEDGMALGDWLDREQITAYRIFLNSKAAGAETVLHTGDVVHVLLKLGTLPFERIPGLVGRHDYDELFRKRYLDELLLNPAEAMRCGSADRRTEPQPGRLSPNDAEGQKIRRIVELGRPLIESGHTYSSAADTLIRQRRAEGLKKRSIEQMLSGKHASMIARGIPGLTKRDQTG